MVDIKRNHKIYIPDSCTRTANVQVKDPTTTATYIGAGELVITDKFGTPLTALTATKDVKTIQIHNRALDGSMRVMAEIDGKDITSFIGLNFAEYVPLTYLITLDDSVTSLTDHAFTIRFNDFGYNTRHTYEAVVEYSVTTAETKAQIAAGLIAAINDMFYTRQDGTSFYMFASLDGTEKIKIEAREYRFPSDLNTSYKPTRFNVIPTSFKATVADNKTSTLATTVVTPQLSYGKGTAAQVIQAELLGRGFSESGYTRTNHVAYSLNYTYDAKRYESDGVTENLYDRVVINWEKPVNGVSNHSHKGSVTIFLPYEDNTTSQVAEIVNVLNAYIVTEWGVGTAFIPS